MKRHRPKLVLMVAAFLAATLAPAGASATPPERNTITFTGTAPSELLTAACGVEVTLTATVRITSLTFAAREPGVPEVGLLVLESTHVDLVAVAGDNVVRFREAELRSQRFDPAGTLVLTIAGHHPFSLTGVIIVDLTTGETILFPQHEADLTHACQVLTR